MASQKQFKKKLCAIIIIYCFYFALYLTFVVQTLPILDCSIRITMLSPFLNGFLSWLMQVASRALWDINVSYRQQARMDAWEKFRKLNASLVLTTRIDARFTTISPTKRNNHEINCIHIRKYSRFDCWRFLPSVLKGKTELVNFVKLSIKVLCVCQQINDNACGTGK